MRSADEIKSFRRHWRELRASPTRHDLAARLGSALDRELEQACRDLRDTGADQDARGDAIGRLFGAALARQLLRDGEGARFGSYAIGLVRRLEGRDDATERPAMQDQDDDAIDPNDPFLAWRLGEQADRPAGPRRSALVERAIDAFEAVALSPRDPGNDPGPFARLAPRMDERQVQRALQIAQRMQQVGWGEELSHGRAALVVRLAELGAVDEADAVLASIEHAVPRAEARGAIYACRVAQQRPSADDPLVDHSLGGDTLVAFLTGVASIASAPPDELVARCLVRARAEPDPERRDSALFALTDAWMSIGTPAVWLAAIDDIANPELAMDRLFACTQGFDDRAARRTAAQRAIEAMRSTALPGASWMRWLAEIYDARESILLTEALEMFASALTLAANAPRAWLLQDLQYTCDLVGLLRWLGGERALVAVIRALEEVQTLFHPEDVR